MAWVWWHYYYYYRTDPSRPLDRPGGQGDYGRQATGEGIKTEGYREDEAPFGTRVAEAAAGCVGVEGRLKKVGDGCLTDYLNVPILNCAVPIKEHHASKAHRMERLFLSAIRVTPAFKAHACHAGGKEDGGIYQVSIDRSI
jgi:hypothetical protein